LISVQGVKDIPNGFIQSGFSSTMAALQPPNPDAVFKHLPDFAGVSCRITFNGFSVPGFLNPRVGKRIFSFNE
jgi:hypothetical protein